VWFRGRVCCYFSANGWGGRINHQENKLEKFGKNNKMLLLGACEGGGKSFKVFF